MSQYEKAKKWFEWETEMDVELMIRMGSITKQQVIDLYERDHGNDLAAEISIRKHSRTYIPSI